LWEEPSEDDFAFADHGNHGLLTALTLIACLGFFLGGVLLPRVLWWRFSAMTRSILKRL
jgi:hypothetical protein